MKIKILYYRSDSGRELIKEYIRSLEVKAKAEILSFLNKFENDEKYRKGPYCKKINKDIFEIRIKTKDYYRILYSYISGDLVILLHIFKKKSNKIPLKELKLVIKRNSLYK